MHDDTTLAWPFDAARAAALLEEAGWKPGPDGIRRNADGARLVLDFMTTAGTRSREVVQQVLQAAWRQVGVEARMRTNCPACSSARR